MANTDQAQLPSQPAETNEPTPAAPPATVAGAAPGKSPKTAKPKPQRTLPTDRIALPKQVEILRAYGQLGGGGKSVSNNEVATVVGLHPSTTSLANQFFVDVGLLQRGADGQIPSSDVIAFAKAYQWNAETAPSKLGPSLAASWFGQAILPKVQFRAYSTNEALAVLADAAGASIDHRGQVEDLLELLRLSGLVLFDGDMVKASRPQDEGNGRDDQASRKPEPSMPREAQAPSPQAAPGAFQFSMSVTMADIAALPPEKIGVFMTAIADLMKIKAGIGSKE